MSIREVLSSNTFEQQRVTINLIGTDVGDCANLQTPSKVVTGAINQILTGVATHTQLTVSGITTLNGFVGIGSTPAYDLDVFGDINLTGTLYQNGVAFVGGGGGGESYWAASTLGIHTLSNVGIGTTNPQYDLDIGGDINFTGTLYQNNSPFVASRWTAGTGDNIYRINGNIGVGTTNPQTKIEVNGILGFTSTEYGYSNIRIGDSTTAPNLTPDISGNGSENIFIGAGVGNSTTVGNYNVIVGQYAGYYNTTGSNNVFLGYNVGGFNDDGYANAFIGSNSGSSNISGYQNSFFGTDSGQANTTGNNNVFIGESSGYNNITGNYNIFLGSRIGISTSASNKVIIGIGSVLGSIFDSPDTGKDTQFAVGLNTTGTSQYWLVGNENFNIGIGTTNPTSKLTVGGNVSISDLLLTNNLNVTGVGTFLSSGLKIRNPANTFGYTITGGAIAADRTLNLPVITGTDTVATLGLTQTFTAAQTFSSTLTASSTLTLSGSTTGTHVFGSNQTTGTLTFGGTGGTGTITLGRATTSQTTNIQAGATASGNTKTINLGTGGLSGSFTDIELGPIAGVGTVTINSGTNLGIGSTTPTSKLDVIGDAKFTGVITATTLSTNGPVFVGSGTSTGTINQKLQVSGGAYIDGNLGIGTTVPTDKVDIIGNVSVSGVVTATSFVGDGSNLTGIVSTEYKILDNIASQFNGSATQFTLSSSATNFLNSEITTAARLLISVGGVVQQPDPTQANGFYISGGTNLVTDPIKINFVEAPKTGQSFFGIAHGLTISPTKSYATSEEAVAYSIIFGV